MEYRVLNKIFAGRRNARFLALALCFTLFMTGGPAWATRLDQPPPAIAADGTPLPILSVPAPVPTANEDSCAPLLKSVRNFTPPPSATDRDRQHAGQAAAIGLVFGLRIALGPKETARSGRKDSSVRLDVWQPRDDNSMQAMAVSDYRRCKNDQALKALSDWRWKR